MDEGWDEELVQQLIGAVSKRRDNYIDSFLHSDAIFLFTKVKLK